MGRWQSPRPQSRSSTSLSERLNKIAAEVINRGGFVTFQVAELAV
jgi:hypothetical protein